MVFQQGKTQKVKQFWRELQGCPERRQKFLNTVIRDSWERSYQNKVNAFMKKNLFVCTKTEMCEAKDKSEYLLNVSIPVMENLFEFVAGTGFVVALMDPNLCVLKILGDQELVEILSHSNTIEGSLWGEHLLGTNSASLSASLARPVSVIGYEHFSLFTVVAACSSAPIIDQNKIIGVLSMVAPYDRVNDHTLGMVVESVNHIKSKMLLERTLNYHEAVMNSMSEGVLALDRNWKITYINEKAKKFLKLNNRNPEGSNMYQLLAQHPDNQYFIDSIACGQPINDESFFLTIGKNKIRCNITLKPINYTNPFYEGNLLIIRDSSQVNRMVKNWIGREARMTFDDVIGNNKQFKQVVNIAKTASASSSNVLILGESGTGKDVIAQAMHSASPRRSNPFVAINCAALPRELLASELFGYEEGAFTGAKKGGNAGKFELADQGTIFLDEIGEMPLDLQASLLRVIEEKSVLHLGGNRLIPVNVRIIAATNKDLEAEIARNRFRKDLYYRLAIIKMTMPPLRDRKDDILTLTKYFMESVCKRFGKPPMSLSPQLIEAFLSYYWPGNVRELQNILEGGIQLASGSEITYDLVQEYFIQHDEAGTQTNEGHHESKTIAEVEKQMILDCLQKNHFNKTETAKALGISRRTLYRRLKNIL